MKHHLQFLAWQWSLVRHNMSFWGVVLILLALPMFFLSHSVAAWMSVLGLFVVVMDTVKAWYRMAIKHYQSQQGRQ